MGPRRGTWPAGGCWLEPAPRPIDEKDPCMKYCTCLNFLMMILNVSIHYSSINSSLRTGGPTRINKAKVCIPSHNEHVSLLSGSRCMRLSSFDFSRPRGNDARGSKRIEIFLLLPSSLNSGGSSRRGGMSKAHLAAGSPEYLKEQCKLLFPLKTVKTSLYKHFEYSPLQDWNFNLLH